MMCDMMKLPGAGSSRGREERKFEKPDDGLDRIFQRWLNEHESKYCYKNYGLATQLLEGMPCSVAQAHALLLAHQCDSRIQCAGLFVSAVYNKVADEHIVYDLNLQKPPDFLGYCLPKNKILVVSGTVGDWLGNWVSGVLLVSGTAGRNLGWESYNVVVVKNQPKSYGNLSNAKCVIKPSKYKKITGLDEYITKLVQRATTTDVEQLRKFRRSLGKDPTARIKKELFALLRGAGYAV